MVLDPVALVVNRLQPCFAADPGLEAAIPVEVAAQWPFTAKFQGCDPDALAVYVSLLATRALITRLLLTFGQRVQSAKGGPAEATFAPMVQYLKALSDEMDTQLKQALREMANVDLDIKDLPKWTGCGMVKI